MKLWSRGLGKTEIYMDFRYYRLLRDPGDKKNVMLIGKMQDPVTWEFMITIQPEDIAGVMKAVFTFPMMIFIVRNLHQYLLYLFNRKKFSEGSGDLVTKVNDAYAQVMNPGGMRQRGRERASSGTPVRGTATETVVLDTAAHQETL